MSNPGAVTIHSTYVPMSRKSLSPTLISLLDSKLVYSYLNLPSPVGLKHDQNNSVPSTNLLLLQVSSSQ